MKFFSNHYGIKLENYSYFYHFFFFFFFFFESILERTVHSYNILNE
ncbi:hypothetical protein HanHA300_Chr00c0980g0828521 [Helianthus annuus]|nr:hypothetical protein HanHA300_Chr00c0980g0828521 [Helianthus annuus]